MNYSKIYNDFIYNRRCNPPHQNTYKEVHHIVPRCMGGTDEAINLIPLAPEDHFFAHLLLAKIYNTSGLWAVVVMYTNRKKGIYLRGKCARNSYGFARREKSRLQSLEHSGENHWAHDPTVYEFRHLDGRTVTGNRFDVARQTGLRTTAIGDVVRGKVVSAYGWHLRDTDPEKVDRNAVRGRRHHSFDPTLLQFENLEGQTFTGCKHDFIDHSGLSVSQVSRLIAYPKVVDGWYLTANKSSLCVSPTNPHKNIPNTSALQKSYRIVNIDGSTFNGSRLDMANAGVLSLHDSSYLVRGECLSIGRWRLETTSLESVSPRTGARHHNYSNNVYSFIHDDGQVETCNQHQLCTKYNIDVRNVSAMIKGRKRSSYGWRLVK